MADRQLPPLFTQCSIQLPKGVNTFYNMTSAATTSRCRSRQLLVLSFIPYLILIYMHFQCVCGRVVMISKFNPQHQQPLTYTGNSADLRAIKTDLHLTYVPFLYIILIKRARFKVNTLKRVLCCCSGHNNYQLLTKFNSSSTHMKLTIKVITLPQQLL